MSMQQRISEEDKIQWFAMSAPYCRELVAQELLNKYGIENFIPMRYKISEKRGRKVRELVPAIHNLIFAKTSKSIIQEVKTGVSYLQYRTMVKEGKNVPIVVPDAQMDQFIAVSKSLSDNLVYLQPEEVNLENGARVRILGGPFDGVEGVFVKVKGSRSKKVVVMLQGLTGIALTEVTKDLIQVVE